MTIRPTVTREDKRIEAARCESWSIYKHEKAKLAATVEEADKLYAESLEYEQIARQLRDELNDMPLCDCA